MEDRPPPLYLHATPEKQADQNYTGYTSTTGEDDIERSFMKNYVQHYVLIHQNLMSLKSIL
jgi:hypothetical protein